MGLVNVRHIQHHEICYSKGRTALEKPIQNGFYQNLHKFPPNSFLLMALLLKLLTISFARVGSIKKKNSRQKWRSNAIATFSTLVASMVISPLPKTLAEIKIVAVSSKFCPASHGVILFLVS